MSLKHYFLFIIVIFNLRKTSKYIYIQEEHFALLLILCYYYIVNKINIQKNIKQNIIILCVWYKLKLKKKEKKINHEAHFVICI